MKTIKGDLILTEDTTFDESIKVKGDFNKPEEFKEKINNALEIQKYANMQIKVKFGDK